MADQLNTNNIDLHMRRAFRNIDEWKLFAEQNGKLMNPNFVKTVGDHITNTGFVEPITGLEARPGDIRTKNDNWREGLVFKGINSRSRAVMLEIDRTLDGNRSAQPRMYAAEAITSFALRMRGVYPRFLGSEYTDDNSIKENLFPILFQDLENLTFDDNVFDIVSTNEVLEHLPSIDDAMKEVHRVLKPGGWHIGTCPFLVKSYDSQIRSRIINNKIEHILPAAYHGNPMSDKGSLVFELPGWNLLGRLADIGYRDVFMRFIASTRFGIWSDIGGVAVLCCRK